MTHTTSDILCTVCGEPWYGYDLDMLPWQKKLFLAGAGCPCCEGIAPEDSDPEAIHCSAMKEQIFNGVDDPEVMHSLMDPKPRPEWIRPDDPALWQCSGCTVTVRRDLDEYDPEQAIYFDKRIAGYYHDPYHGHVATESPEHEIAGQPVCPVCYTECGECGTGLFSGHADPVDIYDTGGSLSHPDSGYYEGRRICPACHASLYSTCEGCSAEIRVGDGSADMFRIGGVYKCSDCATTTARERARTALEKLPLSRWLINWSRLTGPEDSVSVRLWVRPDLSVDASFGDPGYDTDHRGVCESAEVPRGLSEDEAEELASDLIDWTIDAIDSDTVAELADGLVTAG